MTKPYKCRVEYLESTDTQWIDTGVNVDTSTDEIKLYFQLTDTELYKWIFGEYDNNARIGLGSGDGTDKRNFLYQQSATKVSDTQMYNKQHLFEINSNGGFLDGTKIKDYANFASTSTIYLFNLNIDSASDYRCKGKIWGYRHTRNGILIRDLIPVLDNSGRPAMYDQVSGQLFYNQDSGDEFTYGRQIIPVEYLESTGTQYIDTGIIGDLTTELTCEAAIVEAGNASVTNIMGNNVTSTRAITINMSANIANPSPSRIRFGNTDNTTVAGAIDLNTFYKYTTNKDNLTVQNTGGTIINTYAFNAKTAFTTNGNILIYKLGDTSTQYIGNIKVKGATIKNNGVLVRDFIPCIDENLVPFMFDTINNTVYLNAGTGQFKVGPYKADNLNKKLLRKKLASMMANLKKKRKYYCEVEYLEGTGTQYINTGLLSTANSKVDCVFGFSSMESGVANNVAVFGGRSASQYTHNTFTFFKLASQNPQRFRFDYNNQQYVGSASNMTWNTTSKYRMSYDGSAVRVANITTNQSEQETMTPDTVFTTQPIYLFAVNTMGNAQMFMSGRIYKYWYTDGTNTIDLIPVLDWDMTPCMYDKVSGQFFYNQGSGTFQYGREIHHVDYLESTGTQFILTGFTPTVNTDFEIELSSTDTLTRWVMGCPTWVGVHYKTGTEVGITNSSTDAFQKYTTYNHDNSKLTMKLVGSTVYANGVSLGTITRRAGTLDFALFGYRDSNQGATLFFVGNIYKCIIWDNGSPVRDYLPAIDENGVGYMFDRVSHTIYDNAGTGVFGYPARETEYIEVTDLGTNNQNPCIDLGLKYKSSMSIEAKYTRTGMGIAGSVLPLSNNTTAPLIYMPALNSTAKTDRFVWRRSGLPESSYYYDFANYPITVEFKVDAVNDALTVNDNVVKTGMIAEMNGYTDPYESYSNLYMLSINGTYGGMGKVYYVKIYDETQVYRDLVPVWKDGVACVYDKQNNVYYSNTKTGTVICGKVIEPEYE